MALPGNDPFQMAKFQFDDLILESEIQNDSTSACLPDRQGF
jgi:hypothetical protein